jgi:hypothetical protein
MMILHSFSGIPLVRKAWKLRRLIIRLHLLLSGIMAALLQEIVSVYPLLSPPALTAHASNRVCNALALLQCVASHSETRQLFLHGECPELHLSILGDMANDLPRQPIYRYFSILSSIPPLRLDLSSIFVLLP